MTNVAKTRVDWVDYAKGLSILFVVVYHVWHGIMIRSAQIPSPQDWYHPIDRGFEMMRIPLFFFVSGLFVGRSAVKGGKQFVFDKLAGIVWPYLIWSCVHIFITIVLAKVTGGNSDLSVSQLLYCLAIRPVAQFWFLYVLFMALILYFIMAKLRMPTWLILFVGVGLMLARGNVDLSRVGIKTAQYEVSLAYWGPFYQLLKYFIYMALGAVLAPVLLKKLNMQHTWLLAGGFVTAMSIIVVSVAVEDPKIVNRDAVMNIGSMTVPFGVLFALISVVGALCAAELMERAKGFAFIRSMGRYSLYIFVMHVIFAAGGRTFLLMMGVNSFAVHMIIGLAAGIVVPIVVAMIVKRLRMTWLFTLRPI